MVLDHHIRAGIIGGTLFGAIFHPKAEDIVETVIMAAIGAIVSFGVSLVLKRLFSKYYR